MNNADKMQELAKATFQGYRDSITGWGVPKDTKFTAHMMAGPSTYPRPTLILSWSLLAGGFGKKPAQLARFIDVDIFQSEDVLFDIIQHSATALAKQCINSYILWCGTKDQAAA